LQITSDVIDFCYESKFVKNKNTIYLRARTRQDFKDL